MDLFRVRLNCVDFYQATPSRFDPLLRNNIKLSQVQKEPKVPVIRVFGATETGQKVCAHIHGAFPYLFIEYSGKLIPDEVGAYIHRLHLSIDYALAVSYRRNVYDGKSKFVARITLVKGIPFYGFHVGYKFYLKIYMLNPMFMTRLADLLRQGVIMNNVFQPYEAHLQYLLQWMADYNLYGCGYIDCRKVSFRSPVPQYNETSSLLHLWHDRSIPEDLMTDESELPRVSHCSIEVDICLQDILNRQDIKPRNLHQDFIERLNPLPPDEKLVPSLAGLWRDETRRRRAKMTNADVGSSPFPAEVLVSMSADPRNSQPNGWIHEEEYREMIASLIVEEKVNSDGVKISFDNFVKHTPFTSSVKTSLEAVEDLYPENLRYALGIIPQGVMDASDTDDDDDDREVDERRILDINVDGDDEYPYDSDEDIMCEITLSQGKKDDQLEDVQLEPCSDMSLAHKMDGQKDKHVIEQSSNELWYPNSKECSTNIPAHMPLPRKSYETEDHNDTSLKNLKRPSSSASSSVPNPKRHETSLEVLVNLAPGKTAEQNLPELMQAKQGHDQRRILLDTADGEHFTTETPAKPRIPTVNGAKTTSSQSTKEMLAHRDSQLSQLAPAPVKVPLKPSDLSKVSQKTQPRFSPTEKGTHVSFDPLSTLSQSTLNPSELRTTISPLQAGAQRSKDRNADKGMGKVLCLTDCPPTKSMAESTMHNFNLPSMIYQDAFYSNEEDVPERAREWAGREFRLEAMTVPFLPDFDSSGAFKAGSGIRSMNVVDRVNEENTYDLHRCRCGLRSWMIGEPPPTCAEIELFEKNKMVESARAMKQVVEPRSIQSPKVENKFSQIDGPTQKNKHGFKYTQSKMTSSVNHEAQYMSTMSLELHVNTRGRFVPNPEEDEVQCVFWCFQSDKDDLENNCATERSHVGIVALCEEGITSQKISRQSGITVVAEDSELDLMIRMADIVRFHDPDILTGYEVHGGSWGYLIERARLKYDYNLCDEFSRMKAQSHGRFGKENDKWGFNNTSTIRVTGRHMINIWRAMRGELNLLQYTIENVVFHVLHRRIPHFTWADLTAWYTNGRPRDLAKLIDHYITRIQLNLEILEQNGLVPRTSEQARLLGVDFFSVFSRGSQFKVESLMFRIAKPENFMLVSPSRKQVGGQNALECLPLVMEPQSAFYNSPLLVLDFQSLYPSVMIAYNYCYSTFLGRIVNWRGINKMGFTEYKRQRQLLELLKDHVNVAPNGMMYVKPEIRKSLLAKMLGEILETRVMVKSGMKADKDDKALQRLLNNRQLALKLIANVTYGYTSASFSGRMPCSEIADSIVQTGRETLEKAIALIHSVKRWGAEVVYGDTDSLFVNLKGRTKDEAFNIGEEIAKTITNMNPRPIKLKFEKVYFPCVLLAKKRYVGFKYEYRDQKQPDFDAKGIETVRRDGTPAEQKIEEKALKILFRTADLSQVKSYFQRQCEKIMKGSVSIQEFCFAKEVRLGTYSDKGPPPPGALISTKRMLNDARAEPQYGERVPYVVITGAPGARLIDRCVAPEELLENDHSELDAEYYISKNIIPPLERIFNVVGANVRNWYEEMPKYQRVRRIDVNLQLQGQSKELAIRKKTLESYMKSSSCLVCAKKLEDAGPICPACLADKPRSILSLRKRLSSEEKRYLELLRVCQNCSGISPLDEVRCDSKDCPVFYTRTRQKARLRTEKTTMEPVIGELASQVATLEGLDW